jgi:hypothetical protein
MKGNAKIINYWQRKLKNIHVIGFDKNAVCLRKLVG